MWNTVHDRGQQTMDRLVLTDRKPTVTLYKCGEQKASQIT